MSATLCGGTNRQGEPCGNVAGFGTSHVGWGNCRHHGGSTRTGVAHAARLQAEAEALKLGDEVPRDPADALLWTVKVASGAVEVIRRKLGEIEAERSPEPGQVLALARLLSTEAERLSRISAAASSAGVEEARLRLDALRLDRLADAIGRAVADARLDADSAERLNAALRVRLGELTDDDLRPELTA
jgi:hypothetical protein